MEPEYVPAGHGAQTPAEEHPEENPNLSHRPIVTSLCVLSLGFSLPLPNPLYIQSEFDHFLHDSRCWPAHGTCSRRLSSYVNTCAQTHTHTIT